MREDSGERIFDQIVRVSDLTDKKVIEIGCGDGRISSLLACRQTASLVAIDPDKDLIERAKPASPHGGCKICLDIF